MPMRDTVRFHDIEPLAYQAMRLVSEGADFFELTRALEKMASAEDWHPVLDALGDEWVERAEKALSEGHEVTARDAFLQAKHCFLAAAEWNVSDPEANGGTYRKCVDAFRRAGQLYDPPLERVEIPYEDTHIPGYLYLPSRMEGPAPTVIVLGGADATKEECDGLGATAAAARGMVCLTLDGPGQGEPMYFEGLGNRPDYEVVWSAALDYLETRPEVDADRIGVLGASFGGYYAVRAGLDPRVKAIVVHGAVSDEGLHSRIGQPPRPMAKLMTATSSDEEYWAHLSTFDNESILDRITCPVLITHGGEDRIAPPDAGDWLYNRLPGSDNRFVLYPDGSHCCVEYYAQMQPLMFDWLADQLEVGA